MHKTTPPPVPGTALGTAPVRRSRTTLLGIALASLCASTAAAAETSLPAALHARTALPAWIESLEVDARVEATREEVVAWRRDIHEHPELGNQEIRTADLVARHLRALGLDEVHTGIANTGVVGVLRGGRPGNGVVALRADMDALPILEATGLPFASRVVVDHDGVPTPVMHACGHDAHTAILMGAAQVLAAIRDTIPGTVLFVFQPAEEGIAGEVAGAALMLQEGVFDRIRPDAMFGLHVEPGPVGRIDVRPGPFLASATRMRILLTGAQTHAARPWEGVDIINLSADVVKSLATLSARKVTTFDPHVLSIGSIQAGNHANSIPGEALLQGTLRTYNLALRDQLKAMVEGSIANLASDYGARADIDYLDNALVTYNSPTLLDTILPALRATGTVDLETPLRAAGEDFSFFAQVIPSVYYILGSTPGYTTKEAAPSNHSDRFDIDESVLPVGVKAQVLSALTFLDSTVEALR